MDNKSFDFKRIAEGYAHRPWLHQSVMEQIKSDCDISQNFDNGLDVGCGAGLSTKALRLLDRQDIKELPIIAMTANAFVEDIENARKAGMNEHMAKPIDIGRFFEILHKWLK